VNRSLCCIRYHWKIFYRGDKVPTDLNSASSPFSVDPFIGIFEPDSSMEFTITFSPVSIEDYSAYLILYIDDVPVPMSPDHPYFHHRYLDYCSMHKILGDMNSQHDPTQFFSSHMSDKQSLAYTKLDNNQHHFTSIPVSFIRVNGSCVEMDVSLDPPILMFGTPITIGEEVKRKVLITNNSIKSAHIIWSDQSTDVFTVQFMPASDILESGQSKFVEVIYTPMYDGEVTSSFTCQILDSHDLSLSLTARVCIFVTILCNRF
jgi:hypothetical protein